MNPATVPFPASRRRHCFSPLSIHFLLLTLLTLASFSEELALKEKQKGRLKNSSKALALKQKMPKMEKAEQTPETGTFLGPLPQLVTVDDVASGPMAPMMGWSGWSEWSKCSAKKCGLPGVQFQARRCLDMYCSGAHARHRVCRAEMEDCPYANANFSSPPSVEPLTLECALRSTPGDLLLPAPKLPQNCSQLECLSSSHSRLVQFPTALSNGLPCALAQEPEQSAVCLHGRCLPVGCDRLVGSRAREDQCGLCGGDGQSCAAQLFRWRDSGHFSPCDRSCGFGGVRVSVSVCVNTHNERVVPERMCADQARPRPAVRKCPHVVCPENQSPPPQAAIEHLWLTGEWADCSVSCGLGEQQREVFCAEEQNGKEPERQRVADQYCWHSKRPIDVRKCNAGSCPEWALGDWSQCQAHCGRGIRIRPVECRADGRRFHDWHCLQAGLQKPAQEQPCWTGTSCSGQGLDQPNVLNYAEEPKEEDGQLNGLEDAANGGEGGQEQWPRFLAGAWAECSASCGPGIRSRPVDCMAKQAISGQLLRLPDYECQGQTRPSLFQSCQLLPCPSRLGASPQSTRSLAQPFPPSEAGSERSGTKNNGGGKAFRWEHGQWTLCSVSCLGGRQKSPVLCMEVATGRSVALAKCEEEPGAGPKPAELVRACNRHSCPPDWEVGPWSACSHTCGGGLRTRRVRCARVVSRTGASTLILPDGQCPGQRPGDEEPCGMVDCLAEWSIGHWGQCSATCGAGEQRRTLDCIRRDSLGQLGQRPQEECANANAGESPPLTARLCNLGPCPGQAHAEPASALNQPSEPFALPNSPLPPFAYAEPPAEEPRSLALIGPAKDQPLGEADIGEEEEGEGHQPRRLTLRVGGFANLYEGTSVKVKCPVRATAGGRRPVIWTKNGRALKPSTRLKVSQNGALRIFQARQKDAGVYACQTVDGQQQGNVTLRFKPNGDGGSGEEEGEGKAGRSAEKQAARRLLQRVRDSLFRLGERSLYQRLAAVRDPSQIRVDFALSDWGPCEQPECGRGEGVQIRLPKCQIHVAEEAAYLEEAICEAFGIQRPVSTRPCMDERCPRWESGPWSECAESRCARQGTALQRREVRCILGNGTETSPALCQRKSRPKLKKECQNVNCSAEWRPSIWGKCSRKCGDGGVQMRLLRCVWHGTRKPAGPNCEPAQRPAAIRACQPRQPLPECAVEKEDEEGQRNETPGKAESGGKVPHPPSAEAQALQLCEDQSRFCDILRLFQACDQPKIRAQCCFSCRRFLEDRKEEKQEKGTGGRGF